MIFFFPYVVLFSFFLFLTAVLVLASSRWVMVWLFLEVNLLIIVPLMIFRKTVEETESSIKYFLVQVVGRIIILLRTFRVGVQRGFLIGICIKLGIVPFHFWVASVLAGVGWEICGVLLTLQKAPLLSLLLYLDNEFCVALRLIGLLSAILGGIIGINQVYFRPLIGYSSISHIGWLVVFSYRSRGVIWFYFFVYCTIVLGLVSVINKIKSTSFVNYFWGVNSLYIITFLFSLGGLPPLRGFAAKLVGVVFLRGESIVLVVFLVLGSLLSLYYYLCISFFFVYQERKFMWFQRHRVRMYESLLVLMRGGLFFVLIIIFLRLSAVGGVHKS